MDQKDAIPEIRRDAHGRQIFEPDGEILAHFLIDRSEVSIIRGPWGSGTSTGCCMKLGQLAAEQVRGSDGIRRTRFIVTRETYPQLENTTIKTWKQWFPERLYGKFYTGSKPFVHQMRWGDIECEVIFAALQDNDIEDLLSLEPSGWWFNELSHVSLDFFTSAVNRCGRYPPLIEGGPSWSGAIVDLNAPNESHWLAQMMGEAEIPEDVSEDERQALQRPEGWAYYVQPPALIEERASDGRIRGYRTNPQAENLRFLEPDYYISRVRGKTKQWIDRYFMNKVLPLVDGDPVWTSYNPETHKAKEPLEPVPGHPVRVALDFGRRPAALFGQEIGGRWAIQFELYARDMGATNFAPKVKKLLEEKYPGFEVILHGDPKGQDKPQTDDRTAYQIFAAHGMPILPAPVKQNNIKTRLEAVSFVLGSMVDGYPRLLISPRCRRLLTGMEGGYRYPRERETTGDQEKPLKDKYSDVADCLQYMMLGGGEGREMIKIPDAQRPRPVNTRPKSRSRRRIGRGRAA